MKKTKYNTLSYYLTPNIFNNEIQLGISKIKLLSIFFACSHKKLGVEINHYKTSAFFVLLRI